MRFRDTLTDSYPLLLLRDDSPRLLLFLSMFPRKQTVDLEILRPTACGFLGESSLHFGVRSEDGDGNGGETGGFFAFLLRGTREERPRLKAHSGL